jgi:hypothetical protein
MFLPINQTFGKSVVPTKRKPHHEAMMGSVFYQAPSTVVN